MMLSPVIETERLILRRFKESDIDNYKKILCYLFPNVKKYLKKKCIYI